MKVRRPRQRWAAQRAERNRVERKLATSAGALGYLNREASRDRGVRQHLATRAAIGRADALVRGFLDDLVLTLKDAGLTHEQSAAIWATGQRRIKDFELQAI